jgi:hypothetical protein
VADVIPLPILDLAPIVVTLNGQAKPVIGTIVREITFQSSLSLTGITGSNLRR